MRAHHIMSLQGRKFNMEAEARITSVENWQIQRQGWTFEVTDKAEGSHFGKVTGSSNF